MEELLVELKPPLELGLVLAALLKPGEEDEGVGGALEDVLAEEGDQLTELANRHYYKL